MSELNDQNEIKPSLSTGDLLRHARETKQWSLGYVANCLKLNEKVIRDLESDDSNDALNPMYYRGYLTSYVRLLGPEAASILSTLPPADNRVFRSQELHGLTDLPVFKHTRSKAFRLRSLTWGVVLLLSFLVVTWWYQQSRHQSSNITIPTVAVTQQQEISLPKNKASQQNGQYAVSPVTSGTVTGS